MCDHRTDAAIRADLARLAAEGKGDWMIACMSRTELTRRKIARERDADPAWRAEIVRRVDAPTTYQYCDCTYGQPHAASCKTRAAQ